MFFAQPGDPSALAASFRRLALDPQESARMGLAGRRYLELNFSRERMAGTLMELLEEMVRAR